MQRTMFIPPGGFVGSQGQTVAGQLSARTPGARATRSTSRRRRSTTSTRRKRGATRSKRSRSGSRKQRLVKGSAAAKRYMAKIRRMRKR